MNQAMKVHNHSLPAVAPQDVGDDDSFIIDDLRTPAKFVNFHYNHELFLELSQLGFGDSYLVDSRKVCVHGKRLFYIKEQGNGSPDIQVWPAGQPESYEAVAGYHCTQRPSETILSCDRHDIRSAVKIFLPPQGACEVWEWSLSNVSDRVRELSVYASARFPAEQPMGTKASYDEAAGGLVTCAFPAHNRYDDKERVQRQLYYRFFLTSETWASYECASERFLGCDGELGVGVPAGTREPKLSNGSAEWHTPLCTYQIALTLKPRETRTLVFVAGMARTIREIRDYGRTYASHAGAAQARNAILARDAQHHAAFHVQTPDGDLNRYLNTWGPRQVVWQAECMRNSSAFPIRNVMQDAMGYAFFRPGEAGAILLASLKTQRPDGFIPQWQMRNEDVPAHPFSKMTHNDAPAWACICMGHVIENTGMYELLQHEITAADNETRPVHARLMKAIEYLYNDRSTHGLVRLRDGDWTDPINGPGRHGVGESTWLTIALVYAAKLLSSVFGTGALGLSQKMTVYEGYRRRLREVVETTSAAIETYAWDGRWYVYGYDDSDIPFGTVSEGRMYLNPQTWALMAGLGDRARQEALRQAISRVNTVAGLPVVAPGYAAWDAQVGRISLKLEGSTENGAVYCHAAVFGACGFSRGGYADEGLDVVTRIIPSADKVVQIRQAPTFVPNFYFNQEGSPNHGASSRDFGTGTAAWLFQWLARDVMGIVVTPRGVRVKPSLPGTWDYCVLRRIIDGTPYTFVAHRGTPPEGMGPGMTVSAGAEFPRAHKELTVFIPVA